jgi:hypothetical protein
MLFAIVLGVWMTASVVLTPVIGHFLYALTRRERVAKRSSMVRVRPAGWGHLASHRPLHSPRTIHVQRRAVRGPRAG